MIRQSTAQNGLGSHAADPGVSMPPDTGLPLSPAIAAHFISHDTGNRLPQIAARSVPSARSSA
jgi:hypothetical protein